MGYRQIAFLLLTAMFVAGCSNFITVVPRPKTEIIDNQPQVVATTAPQVAVAAATVVATIAEPTATITPIPSPTLIPTPTPTRYYLQSISTSKYPDNPNHLPRHGLTIVLLVALLITIPWIFGQMLYISYAQPVSRDLTEILIKAEDGLFITAVLSMTARRTFTVASIFSGRWTRIKEFVAKSLEQDLIHWALQYPTLEQLEHNLQSVTEELEDHDVVTELWTDFGIKVVRFNIEARYPQETRDALNRKAEAAAGGQAYLAYANAANLDPNSQESRDLYQVYQQTSGQVDAARNLGGGIANLANILGNKDG